MTVRGVHLGRMAARLGIGLAGWLALPGSAMAHSCAVAATPLAFGTYTSPAGPRADSQTSITVACTPAYLLLACKVSYTVTISHGNHGSPGNRQLAAGSGRLGYGLFSDAPRNIPWGDGGGGGAGVAGSITTSLLGLVCLPGQQIHPLYARIPAGQNVPAGVYADQVMVTITY